VIAGIVTMARGQVSYYHLVALADICQLLTFPELLVYFNRIPSSGSFYLMERFLNITGSAMLIVLDLILATCSLQIDELQLWCIPSASTDPSTIPLKNTPYMNWGSGSAYFFVLCYYMLINVYIIASWFRGRTAIFPFPAYVPSYYYTVAQCTLMTILVTLTSNCTVRWVNQGGDIASIWSFGQITGFGTALLALAVQVVTYLGGKSAIYADAPSRFVILLSYGMLVIHYGLTANSSWPSIPS
jgi:hypothetical protein